MCCYNEQHWLSTCREKIHLQNAFVLLEDHGHNFVHIVGSSELFFWREADTFLYYAVYLCLWGDVMYPGFIAAMIQSSTAGWLIHTGLDALSMNL